MNYKRINVREEVLDAREDSINTRRYLRTCTSKKYDRENYKRRKRAKSSFSNLCVNTFEMRDPRKDPLETSMKKTIALHGDSETRYISGEGYGTNQQLT